MWLCNVPFVAVHGGEELRQDGVEAVEEENGVEEDGGKDQVVECIDC